MILLDVDPGSAHLGLVALDTDPLRVIAATTLDVDPAHPEMVVNDILFAVALVDPVNIVFEYAEWYPAKGADAGRLITTQRTWTVSHDIRRDLLARSPVPVIDIHPRTWRARVVPGQRSVKDLDVRAALPAFLPDTHTILVDTHQRDAAGAGIGYALGIPKPAPPKVATPRAPRAQTGRPASRNDAWLARRAAAALAAKQAMGCLGCVRKHTRECLDARGIAPKLRGLS